MSLNVTINLNCDNVKNVTLNINYSDKEKIQLDQDTIKLTDSTKYSKYKNDIMVNIADQSCNKESELKKVNHNIQRDTTKKLLVNKLDLKSKQSNKSKSYSDSHNESEDETDNTLNKHECKKENSESDTESEIICTHKYKKDSESESNSESDSESNGESNGESDSESNSESDPESSLKYKRKAPEGTFQHYLSSRILELTKEKPDLKHGDRMKIISAEWKIEKQKFKKADSMVQTNSTNEDSKPIEQSSIEGTFQHYLSIRLPELARDNPDLNHADKMRIACLEWKDKQLKLKYHNGCQH